MLDQASRQRAFGPVGDHLYRIAKVNTFMAQLAVAPGQPLDLEFQHRLTALFFLLSEHLGLRLDLLAQVHAAFRKHCANIRPHAIRACAWRQDLIEV